MTHLVWSQYEYQPSFILGFHGCDKASGESILAEDGDHLRPSQKDYDWLGHGIYFWEGNPQRAYEWACDRQKDGLIKQPFVLGAIIDLKHCLDLFDRSELQQILDAHTALANAFDAAKQPLPKNVGKTPDKAGRKLDCATINFLHAYREQKQQPAYDSVRAPFLEGAPLYLDAGFRTHTHIQICVRSSACIKGYFRPITSRKQKR
jgi:hypothetical protein